MALFPDWPEPKAKVTLVVIPRLHKEGFFVGVGLTPAVPYLELFPHHSPFAEMIKGFNKQMDEVSGQIFWDPAS